MKSASKSASTVQPGSRAGDSLLEACWLAAVVLVPLANDPHNTVGFQSIKISLVRTIGLIALSALAFRWTQRRRNSSHTDPKFNGWVAPLCALLLATLVSSVFSLDWQASFFGSPEQVQGFVTILCHAALFTAVATTLRTKAQFDRLVSFALAATVPVSLYALLQWAGGDPAPCVGDVIDGKMTQPVTSFAGHPIYLAGYLVMLMPLTIWRLWSISRENLLAGRRVVSGRLLVHVLILLLQTGAFFASEKRGPFVAAVASAVCAAILLGAMLRKVRILVWAAGFLVLIAGVLVALAVLNQPGSLVERTPVLRSLSRIVPVGNASSDPYRAGVWGAGAQVAMAKPPFVFPDGHPDPWPRLRPLIGYGPETAAGVLTQRWYHIMNGPGSRVENRFHSLFWDTWAATGLLGVTALSWLLLSILYAGSKAAGFFEIPHAEAQGMRSRTVFGFKAEPFLIATSLLVAVTAGGIAGIVFGAGLIGIGFQVGLLAGFVGAVFFTSAAGASTNQGPPSCRELAGLALFAAVVAHWVDLGFVFTTGSTGVIFWILGGAAVALARVQETVWLASVGKTSKPSRRGSLAFEGWLGGLATGAILALLFSGFIQYPKMDVATPWEILIASLGRIQFDLGASFLLPAVFLPTWLIAAFVISSGEGTPRNPEEAASAFRFSALLSLFIGAGFAFFKAAWISRNGPIPPPGTDLQAVLTQAAGFEAWNLVFFLLLIAFLIALAWCIGNRSGNAWTRADLPGAAIFALPTILSFWLFVAPVLRRSAAEGWGQVLDGWQAFPFAAAAYERALAIDPRHIPTRLECALAVLNTAAMSENQQASQRLTLKAENILRAGRPYGEFQMLNARLGQTCFWLALSEQDPAKRADWIAKAREAFQRDIRFAPTNETSHTELALLALLDGDEAAANEKFKSADAITAGFNAVPFAEYYAQQSFQARSEFFQHQYGLRALQYFKNVDFSRPRSDLLPVEIRNVYKLHLTEGLVRKNLGQLREAVIRRPPTGPGRGPSAKNIPGHQVPARTGQKDGPSYQQEDADFSRKHKNDSLYRCYEANQLKSPQHANAFRHIISQKRLHKIKKRSEWSLFN